ncbi:MAG: recombination mediator RecR [Candidatus Babeliaceae bacterium]|jgi:recombination protein RecR
MNNHTDNVPSLTVLLRQLQQVPYLASKNLYRVAHHFLMMDNNKLQQFCAALTTAKNNISKCTTCWAWRENDRACMLCCPPRDTRIICVVETWYDLFALEKTGAYKGTYHVLGGAIYPLEGIGPENLTISALVQRAAQNCDEIILAMNQTPEGEATASFIARTLHNIPAKITCLARGVPVGSSLEFTDKLTLHKALSERRSF